MAFYGWSRNQYSTAGDGVNDVIKTESVTISDKLDLYPVFRPIVWLSYYSGPSGSGATYIPSKYYYNNDNNDGPDHLAVPVRSGYSFDGWYTGSMDNSGTVTYCTKVANADGTLISGATDAASGISVSGGKLLLTKNAQLFARWTVADAQYAVVFWRQSADDDINATEKTYDFAESVVLSAQTGTTVTVPGSVEGNNQKATTGNTNYDSDYAYFYYAKCDDATVVKGNGSTVLNVYYDRCKVEYSFVLEWNEQEYKSMTGLYGQTLKQTNYIWPSEYMWKDRSTSNPTIITY